MRDTFDFGPTVACESAELRLLLAQLDQATHEWSSELDDLSERELVWQPFPGGHSIAALLAHIAGVELYWLHHIAAGEPFRDLEEETMGAEIDQYAVSWPPPPPGRPYAFYRELLQTTRERTRQLIPALGDPARVFSRTRSNGEVQALTLRWLLTHVINHEAYHGGQAVLLALQQRAAKGIQNP